MVLEHDDKKIHFDLFIIRCEHPFNLCVSVSHSNRRLTCKYTFLQTNCKKPANIARHLFKLLQIQRHFLRPLCILAELLGAGLGRIFRGDIQQRIAVDTDRFQQVPVFVGDRFRHIVQILITKNAGDLTNPPRWRRYYASRRRFAFFARFVG